MLKKLVTAAKNSRFGNYTECLIKFHTGKLKINNPVNVDTYTVFTNNEFVSMLTGAWSYEGCACCTTAEFLTETKIVYIVNDGFWNYPKHIQLAILAHEEGHIELGHLEIKRNTSIPKMKFEYAADEFAAAKVGWENVIEALQMLKEVSMKNLDKRILNVLKNRVKI